MRTLLLQSESIWKGPDDFAEWTQVSNCGWVLKGTEDTYIALDGNVSALHALQSCRVVPSSACTSIAQLASRQLVFMTSTVVPACGLYDMLALSPSVQIL